MKKSNKRKKKYVPIGNISQVITKNGFVKYKDERGIFISTKNFVNQKIEIGETPETFLSGKAVTLYSKEASKPFILKVNGRKAPKVLQQYFKDIASEQGISERELFRNKDVLQVIQDASIDFTMSAKAQTIEGTRGVIKYDTKGRVKFDKHIIFEKINEHSGKILIGKKEYSKDEALIYYQKQVLRDVNEIRELNENANPYFVGYEGKYNAALNVLELPVSYSDYQIESPPPTAKKETPEKQSKAKTKIAKNEKPAKTKNKTSNKKISVKSNKGNRNSKRVKK